MQIALIALLYMATPAQAWEHHQTIMAQLMDTGAVAQRDYLKNTVIIPSEADQKKVIENLAVELAVNAEKIPIQKPGKVSVKDFLQGESIDEPDMGMDQDLPDSTDPKNDRGWMGGKTGPTSQGFRHMFFPGIEWMSPLRTLQIPFGSIGQSPERILKLHAVSQKFLQEKNLFWGLRTLLWELHFIQDLHQPFHVMQVPYHKMLPWKELLSHFVARSTQVIANFHYAYEGLVNESLHEGKLSALSACFELSEKPVFPMNEIIVKEIVQFSRSKALEIGIPIHSLWNDDLKDPLVNLPDGIGAIDYYSYLHASTDEEDQKQIVEQVRTLMNSTCELMKRVSSVTLSEIDQAFANR